MTGTTDGLTASARKYERLLQEQDERIADLERRLGATVVVRDSYRENAEMLAQQIKDLEAERDTLERQLALCQKQYAVVEGQATSRKVAMEELRAEVATLARELAEARHDELVQKQVSYELARDLEELRLRARVSSERPCAPE